jgi:hypothetical protein
MATQFPMPVNATARKQSTARATADMAGGFFVQDISPKLLP